MDDRLSLFGSNPRLQAECIVLAAAFADDDLLAPHDDRLRLTDIHNDLRCRLAFGAFGTRRTYGAPDVQSVIRLACSHFPEGAVGFYADALSRWCAEVSRDPSLVAGAVKWLVENRKPARAAA